MRPIRLEVRGFTAFRDAQVIDFDGLDLFAIWGPTGSGKSSLLDAMTYALYGQVERIGNRASLLVSQGQVRLSVLLELELDGAGYRIHRSTSQAGSGTRVLLEGLSDGEWRSFGEGADRVREVNGQVERLLGLDYDAFTRSVILPQGKFAEFLVGDARDRRAILTELLGLGLFGRMSARAQETAKTARLTAEAKSGLLEAEYAEVGEAQLQEARDSEQAARRKAEELKAAATIVEEIDGRCEELGRRVDAISESIAELAGLQGRVIEQTSTIGQLAGAMESVGQRVATARSAHGAAEQRAGGAQGALDAAETRWGKLEEVRAAAVLCERIAEQHAELTHAEEESKRAEQALHTAQTTSREARAVLVVREEAAAPAAERLAAAELIHEQAHRADLVGALTSRLGAGDPCPVCERPLEADPPAVDDQALREAADALAAARAALDDARQGRAAAHQDLALADQAVQGAERELKRCAHESGRRAQLLAELATELAGHFDGPPPDDPSVEISRRMDRLRSLSRDRAEAYERAEVARGALAQEEKTAGALEAELSAQRAALGALDLDAARARAHRAAGALSGVHDLGADLPAGAAALAAAAGQGAGQLGGLIEEMEAARHSRLGERAALLEEATGAVPEWLHIEPAATRELLDAVRAAAQSATGEAQARAAVAAGMKERLARKRNLQEEISADSHRAHVHRELAYELRADRLVDFLQAEALETLAAFGSDRLAYLSGGRYRLAFERDEFFVIDSWNGEDRRSVRTLSGGETFLASLALALALSEQVQSLSVERRAKLDSLFLDEGFGTLDAETLEIVVSAIEQLGGDGRMVGVITHVPELAERMPARLVVTKSPRGSTVTRQP